MSSGTTPLEIKWKRWRIVLYDILYIVNIRSPPQAIGGLKSRRINTQTRREEEKDDDGGEAQQREWGIIEW